jgi:hypothetical protein
MTILGAAVGQTVSGQKVADQLPEFESCDLRSIVRKARAINSFLLQGTIQLVCRVFFAVLFSVFECGFDLRDAGPPAEVRQGGEDPADSRRSVPSLKTPPGLTRLLNALACISISAIEYVMFREYQSEGTLRSIMKIANINLDEVSNSSELQILRQMKHWTTSNALE